MNLDELNELRNFNELDVLYKIIEIAKNNIEDTETVLREHLWKTPGRRVRKQMQDIKFLAEVIRDKIQIRKGVKWSEKRVFAIDKAIKKEKIRLKKEQELIEKRKKQRKDKINNA